MDPIGRFAEVGATWAHLQVLDLAERDRLDLVAAEVLPQVREAGRSTVC